MKEIKIGLGTCGIAAGGVEVWNTVKEETKLKNIEIDIKETGCMGNCYEEVLLEYFDGQEKYLYSKVTKDRAKEIINKHVIAGKVVDEWLLAKGNVEEQVDFFLDQERIVLQNCGKIDPTSIEEYIETGGYQAIQTVLKEYTPVQVVNIVRESGLRGRGGGGFPTGLKWELSMKSQGDKKYIICNADEGDPGAFMDRSILEGNPHAVIEGMIIGAYAIGADEGYLYVRAEYPKAIERLRTALYDCNKRGFLGKKIFNFDFNFTLKIKEGAGAFVCGEETALMASIEGQRGMPRIRPPYPSEKGLWGKPSNINNVETFANIPYILLNGAAAYNKFGTKKSAGTKVFALAGKIKRSGLAEVPMGITIKDIVFKIGGGIKNDKEFKAVQMGGPSGGCIPASMSDLKIDYDELKKTGAIMGSGGMIILDEDTCMVDLAKYFLNFTQNESCGKCTFCRIGTKRMLEILERICDGKGKESDIKLLETLAGQIQNNSLCGLGQTAPNPVLTTLKYFRNEYEDHIIHRKCTAHSCPALVNYSINTELCTGCTLCVRKCPTDAITGNKKEPHVIDQAKCINCGHCFDVCNFSAVLRI